MTENKMFCYQCQETAGCTGCTRSGVCGKTPDVAAMQDLLVWVTRGLSAVTTRLRAEGRAVEPQVSRLITWNLFTTITNANFDKAAIIAWCRSKMANYKVPRHVEFRAELPKSAIGKVLRRALREEEEARAANRARRHAGSAENSEGCDGGDA